MTGVHPLDEATGFVRVRDGTLRATIDRSWWGDRGPHGGFLSALLLRALRSAVDDSERAARALMVHFLDAPVEGVVTLQTSVERSGRSLTTTSVRMMQDDRLVAIADGHFSLARKSVDFDDSSMPAVKQPEDIEPLALDPTRMPEFLRHLDCRPALGKLPFTGAERGVLGGWMRLAGGRAVDDIAIALLMDAWAPAVWPKMTAPVGTPTLDYSIHFVRPVPLPDGDPDDYFLGVFETEAAFDGFQVEDGRLWTRDGTLVARSRQLALLIPRG